MSNLKLTFLAHSGFTVETDTKVLVFDYYQDAQGIVDAYARGPKPLWFFVSHWHGDHFNRHIADYSDHTAQYIVNRDVSLKGVPKDKLQVMDIYERLDVGDVSVTQFGSTDEGGSFLVRTDDCTVFHAGDLNWWHWLGDTDANNADALLIEQFHRHLLIAQVVITACKFDAQTIATTFGNVSLLPPISSPSIILVQVVVHAS